VANDWGPDPEPLRRAASFPLSGFRLNGFGGAKLLEFRAQRLGVAA